MSAAFIADQHEGLSLVTHSFNQSTSKIDFQAFSFHNSLYWLYTGLGKVNPTVSLDFLQFPTVTEIKGKQLKMQKKLLCIGPKYIAQIAPIT